MNIKHLLLGSAAALSLVCASSIAAVAASPAPMCPWIKSDLVATAADPFERQAPSIADPFPGSPFLGTSDEANGLNSASNETGLSPALGGPKAGPQLACNHANSITEGDGGMKKPCIPASGHLANNNNVDGTGSTIIQTGTAWPLDPSMLSYEVITSPIDLVPARHTIDI